MLTGSRPEKPRGASERSLCMANVGPLGGGGPGSEGGPVVP